ncbi:structure-specific recognition protein-domain-containing protein [Multifurca ochricompacta]|uniref:FACT complex subunit POB3 n=1 Tax=Multifurca ochricompacta TaxID=376703 RepID=A0AAD4M8J4_9AGAM|nr:structure-specific recognition protein-domain-containing protein [Multifurca ochricompacta]
MTTQFDRIYRGLSTEPGKFRVASSGMAWRGEDAENVIAMSSSDIKWIQWLRVARGFQLRIGLKDRRREAFDGFERDDHDKLASLLKQHFSVTLETEDISFRGWNWGVTDFRGDELAFLVGNKTSFELPLQYVANSNIAGRTEVSLEFMAPSDSAGKKPSKNQFDEMVEIRFFVPGQSMRVRGSDAGSNKSDAEDDGDEVSAAQAFHDAIKEKAELGHVSGDIILSFEEVLVLTPRGRYDVDMFPDFLRLRGKTYDYKIVYTSISKLFLLPKDDLHILFILGLNVPIRQGQTRYQYLVMQFSREEEITAELNMTEEEIVKYDRLKKHYEDPTFEVVSSVFRALSKKKIISAGSFQSRNGHPGLKANLKAVQGDLFMLEKYIFFVSKQPVLIEISDIHQVVFSRVGAGIATARTFDMQIVTKHGPEYTFTSINKEEHEPTDAYLKDKKVRVKNEMVPDGDLLLAAAGDDSDEEMQSVASDDDEEPRVRRAGDDDDDSEDDEDFQASSSDEGSPTESSSDSEGGTTASDASGDRDMMKGLKKKPKAGAKDGDKAPVKKKKKAAGGDDNDEKPKKAKAKSRPKPKKDGDTDEAMEAMEIDSEHEKPASKSKSKPKPKPKPVTKAPKGEGEEPARKKQKKVGD